MMDDLGAWGLLVLFLMGLSRGKTLLSSSGKAVDCLFAFAIANSEAGKGLEDCFPPHCSQACHFQGR